MDILDIAIAKQLAGGGGGSGTDNYNDLSNLPKINDVTLSGNKSSSALGLQSEITSENKLDSDLIDDTNQDNKFVTSAEKTTWNAKQNAIDADHKLSSSLVSFSEAEAAAIASGIDSSKVGQISTNQTNILLVEQMNGAKNLAEINDATFTRDMYIPCELKANTDYRLMIQSLTSEASTDTSQLLFYKGDTQIADGQGVVYRAVPHGNNVSLTIQIPGDCDRVRLYSGSEGASSDNKSATFTHLMFIEKSIFDAGLTQYMPFALPNYDLTVRESEDRAALAEVVDSGAKNLAVPTLVSGSKANLNYTLNSDNSVSISGYNGSGTDYIEFGYIIPTKTGKYVLSGAPSDDRISIIIAIGTTTYAAINNTYPVTSVNLTAGTRYSVVFTITVPQSSPISIPVVAKPMICSQADWKVSQKYAPYRKNLDQLEATKAPVLSGSVDSGSINDVTTNMFAMYTSNVTDLPTSANYYVETSVFDANSLLQRAYNIATAESYVRVKCVGTWSAWKQITNA